MKKKILIAALTAAAILLSGCQKEESGRGARSETTAETTVETTAETESETTVSETSAPETEPDEPETEPEISGDDSFGMDFGDGDISTLYSTAKTGDGYLTHDRDMISAIFTASEANVVALSNGAVVETEDSDGIDNIYTFNMKNVISGGALEDIYIATTLVREDGIYYIVFGTLAESTVDEALPYCTAGKELEYWAIGVNIDGVTILMPLVAGTEESGYYMVIPVFEMLGYDTSEMTIPETALGDDFDISAYTDIEEIQPSETKQSDTDDNFYGYSEVSDGSVVYKIMSVENDDELTVLHCEMTNKCDFEMSLYDTKFVVNGVDCSEQFNSFFEIPAGKTIYDDAYLDNLKLYAGDTLEITCVVYNEDAGEEVGEIYFEMTLS